MLTFEQIKELVELVASRRLHGVEIERSGFRLKIDGQATVVAAAPASVVTQSHDAPAALAVSSTAASAEATAAPAAPAGPPPGSHPINSPIVGTFYRSPSPEAPPFAEIGQRVKAGQVLCIIEAMKLMNEIESDADGVVLEVYPQNSQAVEFGEPLFLLGP